MTINVNKLSKEDRNNLNLFLKYFVEQIIQKHTQLGVEVSTNHTGMIQELPKNLEVSEQGLIFKELDLSHHLQRQFKRFKEMQKGKSVKFK